MMAKNYNALLETWDRVRGMQKKKKISEYWRNSVNFSITEVIMKIKWTKNWALRSNLDKPIKK